MNVIFSIYPNRKGMGFACVEMPQNLLDFGIVTISPASNERLMERVRKLTTVFRPSVVVVRDNSPTTGKGRRVEALRHEIEGYARARDLAVFSYTREQVRQVFEVFGANSKQEIAEFIAMHFSDLAGRVPAPKKLWAQEGYNMPIFDALALAITHQYLTE